MKKVFTLFFTVLAAGIINNTFAQTCTPDHTGYTTVPDSGILIPNVLSDAQVGVYYEQPITIGIPDSVSVYPLNWMQYNSLTNYITANTWTIVDSSGSSSTYPQWNRLTWQCATIKGTPTTAGNDSISIFVNANISIGGFPFTASDQKAFTLPLFVNAAAGIQDNSNIGIKLLECYPNPAINNITIESPPAVIEITNIQGQLIKTFATTGNKTNIDISAFPSGVYVVEVKTEKGIE